MRFSDIQQNSTCAYILYKSSSLSVTARKEMSALGWSSEGVRCVELVIKKEVPV